MIIFRIGNGQVLARYYDYHGDGDPELGNLDGRRWVLAHDTWLPARLLPACLLSRRKCSQVFGQS